MKLYELLQPNVPANLHHPTLGHVKWCDLQDGQGFGLYWSHGQEKNDPLVVDSTILFDNVWEIYDEPWSGKLGCIGDQCLTCGTRDMSFSISSNPTQCLDCSVKGKRLNKHLLKRFQRLYFEAIRKWCVENGRDADWEMSIFGMTLSDKNLRD